MTEIASFTCAPIIDAKYSFNSNITIGSKLNKSCLVCLDDVVEYRRNFEEHLKNLKGVLTKLQVAKWNLNPKKCVLLIPREVKYLGHIILVQGVKTNPDKTKAVR